MVALWGTGVGAAIFTNRTIYRGSASSAGEWGHTSIVAGGKRCRCGGAGLHRGLHRRRCAARGVVPDQPDGDTACRTPTPRSGPAVCWKSARSVPLAQEALDQAATYLGIGAANLVNLFNPEKIILGWLAGPQLGPALLAKVRKTVQDQALEYTASRVTIELAQLGEEAVALGASTLVVDELLANGGIPPVIGAIQVRKAKPGLTTARRSQRELGPAPSVFGWYPVRAKLLYHLPLSFTVRSWVS